MTDRQRHGFVLLLVLGLIAASTLVIFSQKTELGLDLKGGVELVYQGEPSPQTPKVTQDALNRAVDIMRERVDQLGVSEPEIQTSGGNQISVGLPAVHDTARAVAEVGQTAQLYFYDWEANALTPNGKTVASQLTTQDPTAVQISQGTSFAAPGDPNAGSMALYQAVKLASKQPESASSNNTRLGPEYYLFGAPGSAACAAKSRQTGDRPDARPALLARRPRQRALHDRSRAGGPEPRQASCRPACQRCPRARCWSCRRARSSCRPPTRAPASRSSSTARPPSSTCSRTTSRCAGRTSPTRSSRLIRRATPTSPSASTRRAATPSRT